jgi:hypothetical protein
MTITAARGAVISPSQWLVPVIMTFFKAHYYTVFGGRVAVYNGIIFTTMTYNTGGILACPAGSLLMQVAMTANAINNRFCCGMSADLPVLDQFQLWTIFLMTVNTALIIRYNRWSYQILAGKGL